MTKLDRDEIRGLLEIIPEGERARHPLKILLDEVERLEEKLERVARPKVRVLINHKGGIVATEPADGLEAMKQEIKRLQILLAESSGTIEPSPEMTLRHGPYYGAPLLGYQNKLEGYILWTKYCAENFPVWLDHIPELRAMLDEIEHKE